MRMPSMSAAVLMVIVMAQDYRIGALESRVFRAAVAGSASHRPAPFRHAIRPRMTSASKHLLHFEGGNALSAFRAQALLPRLQAASAAHRPASRARHVHWVWSDAPLDAHERDKLAALLRYGEPYAGPDADGRADRRDAAPGHRLAVGQQGDRHRAQLRPGDPPHRARHRVPRCTLKSGLLGGAQAA